MSGDVLARLQHMPGPRHAERMSPRVEAEIKEIIAFLGEGPAGCDNIQIRCRLSKREVSYRLGILERTGIIEKEVINQRVGGVEWVMETKRYRLKTA